MIFVSYRREDTAGYARALADALGRRFGAERVFVDVDDIGAGEPFVDVIRHAVGASQVLLVLIGRRWLGERADGGARIDDADDFVRQEVAAGLERGLQVIPLLFDGAAMPAAARLPAELKPLATRNAMVIDATRFEADVERLAGVLHERVGAPPRPARRRALAVLAGAAVLAAGAGVWWWRGEPDRPARPAINGDWVAEVEYDWPNAKFGERFRFAGEGIELQGTASFLRVPRGIVEGSVDEAGLRFVTRTQENAGASSRDVTHRYRGRIAGDEIRFVMQTEGGASPHAPVEFTARRAAPR